MWKTTIAILATVTFAGCDWVQVPSPTPSSPAGVPSATTSAPASIPSTYKSANLKPEWESLIRKSQPQMAWGMSNLCPRWWNGVNQSDVWVKLWESIIECESGFNPLSRMTENLGIDSVTGRQVVSEGLLQLSYGDVPNYHGDCDAISWEHDKSLGPTDPKKTILDPMINLRCGMFIANKLFASKDSGKWPTPLGRYWSTARPGSCGINRFKAIAKECQ